MGLLLNKLAELLEVGVAAEELEASEGLTTSSTGTGTGGGTSTTGSATFTTRLGSSFEEVQWLFATGGSGRSGPSRS